MDEMPYPPPTVVQPACVLTSLRPLWLAWAQAWIVRLGADAKRAKRQIRHAVCRTHSRAAIRAAKQSRMWEPIVRAELKSGYLQNAQEKGRAPPARTWARAQTVLRAVQAQGDMSEAEAGAAAAQQEELTGSIRENDAEIARVRTAIDANDAAQASVQRAIDAAIDDHRAANPQLLKTLKQFRLQARPLLQLCLDAGDVPGRVHPRPNGMLCL